MILSYTLSEDDIKTAIKEFVAKKHSIDDLKNAPIVLKVEPRYGSGMNERDLIGHVVTATAQVGK